MKITIDTKQDTKEEIKKIIKLLISLVGTEEIYSNDSYKNTYEKKDIFSNQQQETSFNAFTSLFSDNSQETKQDAVTQEEEQEEKIEIIPY